MIRRCWKLTVYFSDKDPRVLFFHYDYVDAHQIMDYGDILVKTGGAIDYKMEEVWVEN